MEAPPLPPPGPQDSTGRSSTWWLLPLGLLAIGMVLAAWGCTTAVQSSLPLFTDEIIDAQPTLPRELDVGTWAVYADSPSSATQVAVTSPSGESVTVRPQSSNVSETISRSSTEFVSIARFEVTEAGVHQIALGPTGRFLLGPPVLEVFSISGRAAAMIVGGIFLTIGGMVLWYRRTRSDET